MLFNILGTKEILKNQQYFNVKRVKPSFSYISVTPFSYSYEIWKKACLKLDFFFAYANTSSFSAG